MECRWSAWDAPYLSKENFILKVLLWLLPEWNCPGLSGEPEQFNACCPLCGEAGVTKECFSFLPCMNCYYQFRLSFQQMGRKMGALLNAVLALGMRRVVFTYFLCRKKFNFKCWESPSGGKGALVFHRYLGDWGNLFTYKRKTFLLELPQILLDIEMS